MSDDPRFGLGYALVAYGVIFVAFYAYLGWLHVRQARLRRRVEDALERLSRPRT